MAIASDSWLTCLPSMAACFSALCGKAHTVNSQAQVLQGSGGLNLSPVRLTVSGTHKGALLRAFRSVM